MTEAIRCSCQQLNDPWRRYCGGCGNALGISCRCGFPNNETDRYCGGCGVTVSRPSVELPAFLRRPPPTVHHPIILDNHPIDLDNDTRTKRLEISQKAPEEIDSNTQRMEIIADAPPLDTSTQQIEMLCDAAAVDPS